MECFLVAVFSSISVWLFVAEHTRQTERLRFSRICEEAVDFRNCKLTEDWVGRFNAEHGVVTAHFLAARTAASIIKDRALGEEV